MVVVLSLCNAVVSAWDIRALYFVLIASVVFTKLVKFYFKSMFTFLSSYLQQILYLENLNQSLVRVKFYFKLFF
jgi:hypothetical protein